MDETLSKQNIEVARVEDRVVLRINRLEIPIPYATAFKIAQGFRIASKEAMRVSGEPRGDWRERSRIDYFPPAPPLYDGKRQTLPAKFNWSVAFEGENVVLTTGNVTNAFHFAIALKISEWMRLAAAAAKRWAGDSGRQMIAAGSLTDAEKNYKRGQQ